MKKRLICLLAALLLGLALAPRLMHLAPAREFAFSWLGKRLAGELSADSCSFGWFSGLRCRAFSYRHRALPVTVRGDLRSDKGLFMLLLAPHSLGDIHLDHAVITLRSGRGEAPVSAAPDVGQAELVRWWNRNGFRLLVEHGVIEQEHAGRTAALLPDVAIDALLENGSLRYTLSGRGGDGSADNLRAEGYLNAPPEGSGSAALLGAGTIILDESPLAALPCPPGLLPAALDGRVGGSCRILNDADGALRAEGALMAGNLQLSAPILGDTPVSLGRASLLFDAQTRGGGHLRVDRLRLESGAANLDLSGFRQARADGGESKFEASASLFLPFLAETLRGPLRLHDDVRLGEGEMRCGFKARGPAARLPLKLDCELGAIEATRAETPVRWQAPLALHLEGRLEDGRIMPERARAEGPLARFEAGPDPEGGFALEAEADLGALLRETERLAALPWGIGGKLKLSLRRGPAAEPRRSVIDCAVDGFFVDKDGEELLPPHALRLTGSATERGGEIRAAEARASAWPGTLALDIPALRRTDAGMQAEYRLSGSLLTARALSLARRLLPESEALSSLRLNGSAEVDLSARLRDGQGPFPALLCRARHDIAGAKIELTRPDFKWRAGDADCSFRARAASLAVGAAAEGEPPGAPALRPVESPSFVAPAKGGLALKPLALRADNLTLDGDFALNGWGREKTGYALHLGGDLDGGALENLLRSIGRMPAGARARGPARMTLRAEAPGKTPPETEIALRLDRLLFGREKKTLWEQRDLDLHARFRATDARRSTSWDLHEFRAESPNFQASGKGFLLDQGRAGAMLALDGRYRAGSKAEDKEPAPFQLSVQLQ